MSRKRYTPEQIIGMLREAEVRLSDGQSVSEICRTLGQYRSTQRKLFVHHWPPEHIRSDNGPEFVAKAVREWLARLQVKTPVTPPRLRTVTVSR